MFGISQDVLSVWITAKYCPGLDCNFTRRCKNAKQKFAFIFLEPSVNKIGDYILEGLHSYLYAQVNNFFLSSIISQ